MNNHTNVNTALNNVKTDMEDNWLDVEFAGRWEDVTNKGGINTELESNQFLVAMRVGIGDTYFYYNGKWYINTFDYHFWYRTNTGEWTNKHGGGEIQRLNTDLPSTNYSKGWQIENALRLVNNNWEYYNIENYYNSNTVYYRITVN